MEKKIKVLYFVDRMLKGGIQSLVVDIAKYIEKEQFQLDFLLLDDGKNYELEETLKLFNCNIFKLENIWLRTPIDYIKYYKQMKSFFKTIGKSYDIVHMHSSSKNFLFLFFAKKSGVKVRIAHSHNTGFQTNNIIKVFFGNLMKKPLIKNSTHYIACSKEAAKWLFGERDDVKILKNGIDVEKYIYDENTRKNLRKKYKLKDEDIICGCVGRVVRQKNYGFLVDLFRKICEENKNYKLFIVGEDNNVLGKELKQKIIDYKLDKNIIFVGFKEDAYRFFNVMDIFLFPSLFEGLGIALIEAQANGMNCIVSKAIPKEAIITKNVKSISLDNKEEWVKQILSTKKMREDTLKDIRKAGYDIKKEINMLENYYKRIIKER